MRLLISNLNLKLMAKPDRRFSLQSAPPPAIAARLRTGSCLIIIAFAALAFASHVAARPQDDCAAPGALAAQAEGLSAQWKVAELRSALDLFKRARVCWGRAGLRREEAGALKRIGDVHFSLSEYKDSLDAYQEALQYWKQAGDRLAQGYALVDASCPLFFMERPDTEAWQNSVEAASIARELGDHRLMARAENISGRVCYTRGNFQEADAHFAQALAHAREAGAPAEEAQALHNIGQLRNDGGELRVARDSYQLALPLWRAVHDRQNEVRTLNALGLTYALLGENQTALEYLDGIALPLLLEAGDLKEEAIAHNNIGYVYQSLGDYETALSHHRRALAIFDQLAIPRARALTSLFIGDLCMQLGMTQEAGAHYERGLALVTNHALLQADMLNGLGLLRLSEGRAEEAYELFRQSLSAYETAQHQRRQAFALNNIGWYFGGRGNWQQAADYFRRALASCRAVGDRLHEALTLYNIARAGFELGDDVSARANIEAGLQVTESLRSRVTSNALRTSYFASAHRQFELYVAVLMRLHARNPDAGFAAAAFEASERGRARSLLETIAEARVNIRWGVDSALLERERELQLRLNTKAGRRVQLLTAKASPNELAEIEQQVDALATEYQKLQDQIKASSPRYAAFVQPAPLTLKQIQEKVLDEDTVLLEYSLGEERSFVWAVTAGSIKGFELPARAQVEKSARRVYELLTTRNRQVKGETDKQRMARFARDEDLYAEAARELSAMLLNPVAGELRRERVVIVADGALQYVPFAALPTPGKEPETKEPRDVAATAKDLLATRTHLQQDAGAGFTPLIARHEVVSLPSASVLALMREELRGRRPAPRSVAVLADPVFDKEDERLASVRAVKERQPDDAVTRRDKSANGVDVVPVAVAQRALRDFDGPDDGAGGIARLPFSRREAQAVMASVPAGDGMLALGFRASRETATSPDLSQYRIVHFATHGLLNSKRPELSGIVLSLFDEKGRGQQGFLELNEIYNLNLPADLVVLSACQTALGKDVRGEGLVGLTRGFMYAGAARVVASLWKVDDAATAKLMGEFYNEMLGKGLKPAAALRAAQLRMSQQPRWHSPYYWAAFTLQGEWK